MHFWVLLLTPDIDLDNSKILASDSLMKLEKFKMKIWDKNLMASDTRTIRHWSNGENNQKIKMFLRKTKFTHLTLTEFLATKTMRPNKNLSITYWVFNLLLNHLFQNLRVTQLPVVLDIQKSKEKICSLTNNLSGIKEEWNQPQSFLTAMSSQLKKA